MSVNLWVHLPPNVRVHDVARVLGRLVGLRGVKDPIGGGSWAAGIRGVLVRGCSDMPCAQILLADRGVFLFHFEAPGGRRLLSFDDTTEGRAMGAALVGFFGGWLRDEGGRVLVERKDRSDEENHAEDGAAWTALQQRILDVKPVESGTDAQVGEID